MKYKLTTTIDQDVYLHWKFQNINLSEMVNDFLKVSMVVEEKNVALEEAEREIEDLREEQKHLNKKQAEATMTLLRIKQKLEKENKEILQEEKEQEEENSRLGKFLLQNNREILG